MQRPWLLLTVVAATACAPRELRVTMNPDNNSGQSGFAVLLDRGARGMTVTVETSAPDYTDKVGQEAHIHQGNCGELGTIQAHLNRLVPMTGNPERYSSTTELSTATSPDPVTFTKLKEGEWVINVHDQRDFGVYVSCGEIPRP